MSFITALCVPPLLSHHKGCSGTGSSHWWAADGWGARVGPLHGRSAPGLPSLLSSWGTAHWEQSQPRAACRRSFSIGNINCLAVGKLLTKCPPKQQKGGRRHSFTFSCSQSCVIKLQLVQRGFPGWRQRDSRTATAAVTTANETCRQPLTAGRALLRGCRQAARRLAEVQRTSCLLRRAWGPLAIAGTRAGQRHRSAPPAFIFPPGFPKGPATRRPLPASAGPPGARGATGAWAAHALKRARVAPA